jgi:hypothetical protein
MISLFASSRIAAGFVFPGYSFALAVTASKAASGNLFHEA